MEGYRFWCNNDKTYVISGNKQTGYGVTTALFKRHGFIVIWMRRISKLRENGVISIVQLIKMETRWIFNFVKNGIIRLPMPL